MEYLFGGIDEYKEGGVCGDVFKKRIHLPLGGIPIYGTFDALLGYNACKFCRSTLSFRWSDTYIKKRTTISEARFEAFKINCLDSLRFWKHRLTRLKASFVQMRGGGRGLCVHLYLPGVRGTRGL